MSKGLVELSECEEGADSNLEYALSLARQNQELQGQVIRLKEDLRQSRDRVKVLENHLRPARSFVDRHPGSCAAEYGPGGS